MEENKEALAVISDFAKEMCDKISLEGAAENVKLSGEAKAELSGLLKKLVKLGIKGAADYQGSEYQGVLQRDLVTVLKESRDCRITIFNELKDLFLLPVIQTSKTTDVEALSIEVISPKDGESVTQFTDIHYLVNGQIPEDYNVILAVCDPIGQWWSWGEISGRNVYHRVQLGVDIDRGKPFEIRVIVTDEEFPINQPRRILPVAIASESVKVFRN